MAIQQSLSDKLCPTLMENKKRVWDLHEKLKYVAAETEKMHREIEREIVSIYNKANITPDICDHPVEKYEGMGESRCSCCNKALY